MTAFEADSMKSPNEASPVISNDDSGFPPTYPKVFNPPTSPIESLCVYLPNGLIPFDYLHHLLEELPRNHEHIDQLLPWNVDLLKPDKL